MKKNTTKVIKAANKYLVMQCIQAFEPVTLEKIAEKTLLSRPTILEIINSFKEEGIVVNGGFRESTGGRPPQLLCINGDSAYAIGIDFEFPTIRIALANAKREIVGRRKILFKIDTQAEEVLARMLRELEHLLDLANDIEQNPEKYAHACDGKKIATLFYEPSTRTRLSFEAAMLNLGGKVLGFSSADSSSATKGESVADTIRVISSFADICAMRHPKEGAPTVAALHSGVPVINAGDGGHNHPTQTLIDLMTIRQRLGRLDNLTIGFCGDLKFGRTVHSLVKSLVRHTGNKFYFISPEELRIPDYLVDETLEPTHTPYEEVSSLEDSLPKLDVLYMTRVQKERFFNEEDYIRLKDTYVLNREKLQLAKENMPVLHPLPRVDEIAYDVDDDSRAAYFQQVQNGKYVRMAVIMALLEITDPLTGQKVL